MSLHGVAPDRVYSTQMFPSGECALTALFHYDRKTGYISLLHLSWGHPRQALPVILALWSPDFPHLSAFAAQPRLSDLVAGILYSMLADLSNILQNVLFVYILLVGRRLASAVLQELRDDYAVGI